MIVYLIGIAYGSYVGKEFCRKDKPLLKISGISLLIASIVGISSPLLFANFTTSNLWALIYMFIIAFFISIVFPISHHIGANNATKNIGWSLSKVYVCNIAGSSLGPLVTGFILLDFFKTQQVFFIISLLSLLAGLLCIFSTKPLLKNLFCSGVLIIAVITLNISDITINSISDYSNSNKLIKTIETKQGIISIFDDKFAGDIIYGGNVYDGRTNLNPVINSNGINRVLILSALKEQHQDVLIIGMSIGTWLKLVTGFPNIKNIDVVEINPGYLTAIQDYPILASALKDKRVHLYIDDGRRWLKTKQGNKYDLIIMNTTWHWRAFITNLLSIDFLRILKAHMKHDALLAYNSTGSPDVFYTASKVFKYVYLYSNFVFASDVDFKEKIHQQRAFYMMKKITIDGNPLFTDKMDDIIEKFQSIPLLTIDEVSKKTNRPLEIVTDTNLITEYKYGRKITD